MSEVKKIPRFLIGAAASGSGKTLITCGILQALQNRGLKTASFKCGPDYIDPMFHSRVIGAKSRNLDTFFTTPEVTRYLLHKNAQDCDISVIEGVMGYYDGLAGVSSRASAWDVAGQTQTPAVFIVNCKGMSLSVVPYLKGFLEYRKDSHIRGVILNQVSPMLYPRLKALVQEQLSVRVLGYVPVLQDCVLESRHLGLVMPEEIQNLREKLNQLAEVLEKSLDLDGLLELAKGAADWGDGAGAQGKPPIYHTGRPVRVAVARDEAFCFFYEDNLELLQEMGAELVYFSPIRDLKLPEDVQGLILNGGYPELYAKELSENVSMRDSIRQAVKGGLPYTAECGGFMYLHREMKDMEGNVWPMAGVIEGRAFWTPRLTRFGYISLEGGTCFGQEVKTIPAHEFHYFDSDCCGEAFTAKKPLSDRSWRCIHSSPSGLAGFPHLYYYSNLQVPQAFLEACEERKEKA